MDNDVNIKRSLLLIKTSVIIMFLNMANLLLIKECNVMSIFGCFYHDNELLHKIE